MAEKMTYEELETRVRELEKEVEEKNQLFIQYKQSKEARPQSEVDKKGLKHIEWLLKKNIDSTAYYEPPYGDLTHLNKSGLILNSVGSDVLQEIAHDFMDLLGTSSAVYEKNGDYALGIFSSGWCQFLDRASYNLCGTDNKRDALDSGKWHCHESCWRDASKICIETGEQVDIECNGGINIYAVPIYAGKEVIGAINFGYGDTPKDNQKLKEISDKYKVDVNELTKHSQIYQARPAFIINIAKKRLVTASKLIGEITHRKQAEHSLYESEARFKALHNASFGGIAIHDKGVILDCNQGLSEITGYSMTELTEMDGLLLIAEKSRYFVMQNILSGYEKPYEAMGLRKNGEEYPIRLEGRNIPYKGKNVRVVEFRDITEQNRVEAELRLTQYSINHIADSIFWIDKSANFLFVNDATCKNLGYSREELLKMNVFDVDPIFPKEQLEEHWQKISKSNAVVVVETIHQTKDGRQFPVEVTTNLLEYEGKQYNVAVARDITARKQAEIKQQELDAANLRLQKAESLSQMAGGIAHLFNNYLYAVSGNLELALEELPDDSLIRNNLTEAMKAARRCADVAGSMLHYLGQNFVKTQSLDMSEFCRKILSDFQSQSSVNSCIAIETKLMDAELPVSVNASQMQQVLNHLITNACESIGEKKGRITLITKTISASNISKFHLLPVDSKPSADSYACVEVTDTGCGISKEDLHKISDPFFTTKFTGRGLGLAVVSGIVKSWGGCIGVKSKVGHGSTFMVFIPLSKDNSIRQSQNVPQSSQSQQKEFSTVLLVEDHEMVRNMATTMLKRMGFEVISAVNGVEAVEKFRQHKDSISCLITDLSMPELDGWGTLAAIRKIKPNISAILASGYDEAFAMSSDDSEKPQAFLHKPYSMKELKSALGQALNS